MPSPGEDAYINIEYAIWSRGSPPDPAATLSTALITETPQTIEVTGTGGIEYRIWGTAGPALTTDFQDLAVAAIGGYSVATLVERLMLRAGYTAAQFDVSGILLIDEPVYGLALTQSAPTRSTLELLMATYFFDMRVSDKIYFVRRGEAVAQTLVNADLGYADENTEPDPFQITKANDFDLPAKIAFTYANYNLDHQTDMQVAERVGALSDSIAQMQVPISLTQAQAKGIADSILRDQERGAITAKVSVSSSYSRLEPNDVVNVIDSDGNTWRMRIARREDSFPLIMLDLIFDDDSVFTWGGLTSADYERASSVSAPGDVVLAKIELGATRNVWREYG